MARKLVSGNCAVMAAVTSSIVYGAGAVASSPLQITASTTMVESQRRLTAGRAGVMRVNLQDDGPGLEARTGERVEVDGLVERVIDASGLVGQVRAGRWRAAVGPTGGGRRGAAAGDS